MTPIDYFVLGIILLLVGGIVAYMIVSKKRGNGCSSCHSSGKCSGNCPHCKSMSKK